MRVIIAGGTGLIGRHLSASLLHDGHEVIVLSRNPQSAKDIPPGTRLEAWDGKTSNGWGDLADGAGAIVNLSGEPLGGAGFFPPRWTPALKQKFYDSRSDSGLACVEAIKSAKKKPEVLIQASAIGYYGVHPDKVITEESGPGDDFSASVCIAWEASDAQVEEMGIRRVMVRTGLVLDREAGILPRTALPFRLFVGGPFGDGKQWMSWIHIDDEVAAIRFLIHEKTARGPFNLTAPNPVQNREFARTLGNVMRRPAFMPAPAFAFRMAFGEAATLVLDGQHVLPKRLSEAGFKFKFETLEQALKDLV